MSNYQVGDKVRMLVDVGDAPDGDSPGGLYVKKDEILIVRGLGSSSFGFPIKVSHEHITERSFGVAYNEVELVVED